VFLFHQKTLNKELLNFNFPSDLDSRHQSVLQWIQTLDQGTLDQVKEVSLHGQFFQDFFQRILGYRSVIEGAGKNWEIHSESTISDGGGVADGAIGFFNAIENDKGKVKLQGKIVAPIELKGSKTDLDRPLAGKKETPVDQGWRYANYTPNCQWVIVSNYREIRLYQLNKTPAYCEQFFLKDLADIENFKRFYFIFCRQNFLASSSNTKSRIDNLFDQSNEAEEFVTKELYQHYKRLRIDLLDHFRRNSPSSVPNWEMILIEKAQKTLDRLLFIAFCEDRRLLPEKTIRKAHDFTDPYYPRPIWHNYKRVFQWVNQGNEDPPISGYNGGLFKHDSLLDEVLNVPDSLCSEMNQLTRFDFETEVSVDILGRIFEQSVTDLEELRAVAKGEKYDEKKGKRKTQGVFYTPAFITQYIVQRSLGKYLDQKEQELREQSFQSAPNSQQEILFWKTYRDNILQQTKIIDPSCGSGAFLIAAYNYLLRQYERVNLALVSFNEVPLNRTEINQIILKKNLYGVDLSPESVEITKLSLWLQTAEMGKQLTDLENNIKVGNSIIDNAEVHSLAFNWQTEFSEVFSQGGFDVVIGNPPYVRQELLSSYKPYLQQNYDSYDGVADLYTYFYEKGLKILKSDGILSYIVTNKWLRSGYGEALRKFFVENTIVDQIVDFGHAPIFEDADTFPCIIVAKKVLKEAVIPKQSPVLICPVPRNKLKDINLSQYVDQEGFSVEWSRFSEQAWSLESPQVDLLMQKIKNMGIPLKEFTGVKSCYGIKTGFNEAFFINEDTKNKLVQADPKCAEIIKPYLRGQDIKRWSSEWQNLWMIFTRRGIDIDAYPEIKKHLTKYRKQLEGNGSA
jgi:type I restriction-modification system DNA methylase subunit